MDSRFWRILAQSYSWYWLSVTNQNRPNKLKTEFLANYSTKYKKRNIHWALSGKEEYIQKTGYKGNYTSQIKLPLNFKTRVV